MNANERFEYMAEQFYKKTGMLAPGKDDAIPRSDEYKRKASCAWGIFTEKFYSNLFQTHADMYEMLEVLKEDYPLSHPVSMEIEQLLKRARGEQ